MTTPKYSADEVMAMARATQPHSPDAADSGRVTAEMIIAFHEAQDDRRSDTSNIRNGLKAALAAQPQSAASPVGVPDGWFQVPHQPTAEMFNAALSACALAGVLITCNMLCAIYQSMLAAAPSATPEGGEVQP